MKISALLLAMVFALSVAACEKPGVKEEEAAAPAPESANPYAVQIKVMEKARDLKAETERKLAEQKAREAALIQQEEAGR